MDLLQQARAEIDDIDAQLAALFERRMHAVEKVARYKAETGKAVYDPAREQALLQAGAARVQEEALRPYYTAFLREAMAISRAYQHAILGQNAAAYQGVQGAWSHIALRSLFPFAKAKNCATWQEVFEAVEQGNAKFGVLPFENSNAGDVSTVLDLLYAHPELVVSQMCDLPIRQDLLALPGAKLEDIRTVVSHQQALAQSSVFLRTHGAATRVWGNTADAARYVAEQGDKTLAAIASAETARLYGLQILAAGVNEDGDNTTRFIVIERGEPAAVYEGARMALLFTVDHKPGKLAQVIQLIGEQGFNMECIKSRPLPHVPFEYYFYVQLVCPPQADRSAALLQILQGVCRTVRVLGVFDLCGIQQEGEPRV